MKVSPTGCTTRIAWFWEKRMEEHLRIGVCYWHSFNWPGSDIFGVGTFDRPWLEVGLDPMAAARAKQDAAFEFFAKLGTPYFSFHDVDMSPEGETLEQSRANLEAMVERAVREDGRNRCRTVVGGPPTCSPIPAMRRARPQTPTPKCSHMRPPKFATCWTPHIALAATTMCSGEVVKDMRPCSTPAWPKKQTNWRAS